MVIPAVIALTMGNEARKKIKKRSPYKKNYRRKQKGGKK